MHIVDVFRRFLLRAPAPVLGERAWQPHSRSAPGRVSSAPAPTPPRERRRRAVFVTRRYGGEVSATSVRLQAYTQAVRARGFDVTVVTRFPFAASRIGPDERGRWRWVLFETVNGCRVWRLRFPAEGRLESGLDLLLSGIARTTATARILGMEAIDFLFACLAVPWVLTQRPQVVVVEQGPVWLALPLRLCARAGAAVVLQISDVKSTAMARGLYGPVAAASVDLNARLEARVWRSATRLVTVTERLRAVIATRSSLPSSAVDLIPNGVELDCVSPASAESRERCKRALGLGGRFVAIYAGSLSSAHDLDTVVHAATLLGGEPAGRDISLLIIGEGPRRQGLTRLIAELGSRQRAIASRRTARSARAVSRRRRRGVVHRTTRPERYPARQALSLHGRGCRSSPLTTAAKCGSSWIAPAPACWSKRRTPPHWRPRSSDSSAIPSWPSATRTAVGAMRKPITTGGSSPPTSPASSKRRPEGHNEFRPRSGSDEAQDPRAPGRRRRHAARVACS